MDKESSRNTFEKKFQHITKKRVLAYQKLINDQNFVKLQGETEFIEGVKQKPQMYEDGQKEFNQKYSKQYNQIQTLYKKCIQNKKNNNQRNKQTKQNIKFNINKDLEV
ncbi:unnamed protein product [Paramecium pentaurelia]|uniref:Uncharacterized protein n=1 Tax=Paramecium pentaurelia TaxID=43138 RepID=A0A8S1VUD8_9CILI|nr:unnamed protein product [Paramecium pentaurelia]